MFSGKGFQILRICIVSWDEEAQITYRQLRTSYQIDYVIERDHCAWGTAQDELQIVSFSKGYRLFHEKQFDVFLIPAMRGINVTTGIFMRLRRNGIPENCIWYAPLTFWKKTDREVEPPKICPFKERKELDFVALHIADHCNLNCAYCSVFCGLVDKPSFPDTARTLEGIALLHRYYDQVLVLRILGGEPLLNDEWLRIALYARRTFPLADIEVVTNGLKILQLPNQVLSIMKEQRITFDISYYPIIGDKIDAIQERLQEQQIRHYITQENEFFSRLYTFSHPGDANHNYQVCKMKFMCLNMYEYRLGVCHALVGLGRAREFLDPEIANTMDRYWIDLSQKDLTASKIFTLLDRPMPICQYCSQELELWHTLSDCNGVHDPKNWGV